MSRATTIQEVINQLDNIIEHAIATNNRLGFFAYVYRRTTAEILREIQLGGFENNELLEQLDVAFANLYLEAYELHENNMPIRKSWLFAFAHKDESLTILQHIMMGMNSHINLDLAISTSNIMNGKDIELVKTDFEKVNDILFNILNEVQDRLSRVSPILFLLDLIGQNSDEKVIDFSMRKARQQSWHYANLLWSLGSEHESGAIDTLDDVVLGISKFIKSPKSRLIRFSLKAIAKFENKDVGRVISKLRED
ncbi:DUF5995 family protein [Psychroserpens sp. AS72]|uniref:DUF5995 family protein n=1 Tax=Psychroserpens sp. AS72 TaxID=3135775 RepID=UPI003174ED66